MSGIPWPISGRLAGWRDALRRPSAIETEVAEWFDDLRAPVLRFVITLGLPAPDAEDVVQETFLALFHHLNNGKPRDNLRGWIFRVAHNQALKRRMQLGRDEVFAEDPCLADPGLNPEEQASFGNMQARLSAVVRALPARDRQCLFLKAEGLRYREIADALDISLGAVAASISRSLAKLAEVRR